MSEYKNIEITIADNGFVIRANNEHFIFNNMKKMKEWMKEHLSNTDEIEEFNDALEDKPKNKINELYDQITNLGQVNV